MKTNSKLSTMKCSCGLEHRIEITDWKLQDYERDVFIADFPWTLRRNKSPLFESMFIPSLELELPYLMLIVGSLRGEKVAYAVINCETATIVYLQRKVETERTRFGFHNEIMEHIINRTLKNRDIESTSPISKSAEEFLKRVGFEPKDRNNPKDRWILRTGPTNE